MLIATRLIRRAQRAQTVPFDTVTLDRASRHKRRVRLATDGGRDLLIDLPEATTFAHGDGFEVDGGFVEVRAAPQPLLEIHCHDALILARIAWHLGNRHTPCEIAAHAIYIEPDHVLAEMVEGLGGHVHEVTRPFEPEGGAYGGHAITPGHGHPHHAHHDHEA